MSKEGLKAIPKSVGEVINGTTAEDSRRRVLIAAGCELVPFIVGWIGCLTRDPRLLLFGYGGLGLTFEETVRHTIIFFDRRQKKEGRISLKDPPEEGRSS